MPKSGNIHVLLPKIAFEKSKLITLNQYKDLSSSKDLNDFVLKLRRFYSTIKFHGSLTLDLIEFELKEALFSVFNRIISYAPKNFQKFFLAYLLKYEMENLKILIRGFYQGVKKEDLAIHYTIEDMFGRREIITESLKADLLNNLKSILQKIPYKDVINEIFDILQREELSFFYLDLLLDLKYLELLWQNQQKLNLHNKIIVKKLIGVKIDSYNYETILRAKNLDLEEHLIYRMISQQKYLLDHQFLDEIIKNRAGSEKILRKLHIRSKSEYNIYEPEEMRDFFYKKLINVIHKYYQKDGFNIGKPLAFLLNKEIEVENLRKISIGVYYKKEPEDVMKRIYVI